jgi:hypothetical protein
MASTVTVDCNKHASGIGFGGALTLLFITLKLIGVIQWSWWWVLSPIWIPITLVLGLVVLAAILAYISRR